MRETEEQAMRIGVFYGSTDGHTAAIAAELKTRIEAIAAQHRVEVEVELLDIAEYELDAMLDFEWLIVGAPTWNAGQLQRDWESALDEFGELDLGGRIAALFGPGDQVGYPDTFADALVFIADQLRACGARLIGAWPTQGYTFSRSWAVEDGRFVGLVLDEHNQPELTAHRLDVWVRQIWQEFHEVGDGD